MVFEKLNSQVLLFNLTLELMDVETVANKSEPAKAEHDRRG